MSKISVNKVAEILKKNEISPAVLRRVIEECNLAVQPDDEKEPSVKKQVVVLVSDPDGRLPKHDFVAWVLKIEESESVATTQDRINQAACSYNASKRGRLMPVKTVGEAIENIKAGTFKEAGVWPVTKTPVLMLRTSNEIPRE